MPLVSVIITTYNRKKLLKETIDSKTINAVGSDEWHAGNLSYHLNSRPKVFINYGEGKSFKSVEDYLHIVKIGGAFLGCSKDWKFKKNIKVNNYKLQICFEQY